MNPLPPLQALRYIADQVKVDDSVPVKTRRHLNYGCDTPILPYSELANYNRSRRLTGHRTVVLENEHLRATFLPELGGRLWSLIHKPAGRELLYVNHVFQITNQAVRNAWFSGGVEWNVSLRGHGPFTCAPLFAEQRVDDDGVSFLRMFEFERVRGVPFVIDCHLPPGSEFLLVQIHLINPHEKTIPMYWWSNIAVPERDGVRVLVPADHAFRYAYADRMTRLPIPVIDGVDTSYPTRLTASADYFYDLPKGKRPWIAALDADGFGLIQTSTHRQRGRKMFVWGTGRGGQCWQRFLSDGDPTYLEIQAGLAQTQYECVPMPSEAHWTWSEAYGPMQADRSLVHGQDWRAAVEHVAERLEKRLPATALERHSTTAYSWTSGESRRWLSRAAGWGALRQRELEYAECPVPEMFRLFPDDSLSAEDQPWLQLLEKGTFPYRESDQPPGSWMVGTQWRERLQNAARNKPNDHWLTWVHLGVMAYRDGDSNGAVQAWHRSLRREPNSWAHRNLAIVAIERGRQTEAREHLLRAHQLLPTHRDIAKEYAQIVLDSGHYDKVLAWLNGLPSGLRREPRLKLIRAQAQLAIGQLDDVEALLTSDFELPDLREGDTILTDLWFELQAQRLARDRNVAVTVGLRQEAAVQCPAPASIDFRMASSNPNETHNLKGVSHVPPISHTDSRVPDRTTRKSNRLSGN